MAGALPEMVRSALGLAIYGMFLAIIVPPARKVRPVLFAVLLSAAVSSLFYYAPILRELSRGWVIILCAVGVSALMAWKFPVPRRGARRARRRGGSAMTAYFLGAVAVMAGVTYLTRMLPLVVFKRRIENRFFQSFLYYVPYAVLAAMTIPEALHATASLLSALAGIAVALVLAFRNKSLLTVALGACATVFVVERLLALL